ncbi:tetratricopeptide repeat protein [Desertivirga brevis]|uniref:tetratricopeptide repeat protein n=1 Tax=Desertivirga brevis TaxID=2810310 RepID=UPI001A971E94|nr:tetratricopeptide repeat protein [Pedobacter sp. SYSU D00873]
MVKRLTFLLSIVCGLGFAQQKKSAVFVVGRVLTEEDSALVREKFFNGLRAKTIDRIGESELYFKEVIQIDPQNDAALYELASIYHEQEEEKIAEKYARDAVTVKSNNKWYWLLLADIYKKNRNYEQLSLVFTDLIHLDPNNPDYYFDKANTLVLLNKSKEAEAVYNDVEKRFGVSNELISGRQRVFQQTGDVNKAAAEAEKLIKSNPTDIRNYLTLSEVYEKSGNIAKAVELLEKAKQVSSANAFLNLTLADLYNKQGKSDEAFTELKAAFTNPSLQAEPKMGILLSLFSKLDQPEIQIQTLELGKILTETHAGEARAFAVFADLLSRSNKLKEAEQNLRKSVELNNQVYSVWEDLIKIEIGRSDYKAVIKDGEEALTLFPNQAPLYYLTALGYQQTGQIDKAVSYLKNAVQLQIEDKEFLSQVYASLGDGFNALKQYKESDEAYNKALTANPENIYVLNNYAYYLSLRGEKLQIAADMAFKANELKPNNSSFEDTYAWVLFKQKKYDQALVWVEKAVGNNSKSGVLQEHWGDILYNLGQKDIAFEKWQKAKELGVKNNLLEKKINEKKYFE